MRILRNPAKTSPFFGPSMLFAASPFLNDILVESPITEVRQPNTTDHGCNSGYVGKCLWGCATLGSQGESEHPGHAFPLSAPCTYFQMPPALHQRQVRLQFHSVLKRCDQTAADEECYLHGRLSRQRRRDLHKLNRHRRSKEKRNDDNHAELHSESADFNYGSLQTKNLLDGECAQPGRRRSD